MSDVDFTGRLSFDKAGAWSFEGRTALNMLPCSCATRTGSVVCRVLPEEVVMIASSEE